nr:BEN domain-containing protein 2 isoform X1 [Microcebus murinus]
MSDEPDFIIVTIEDDSDHGISDDDDDVTVEDSDTDFTQDIFYTDDMANIQPDFEDSSDDFQVPPQMSYGDEGLVIPGDQTVPEMNHTANLKRDSPNLVEEGLVPSHKKGRSSTPRENAMDLPELIESTYNQVNQLCEIVSKMQHSRKSPLMLKCENCHASLSVESQEAHAWASPAGSSLQSAACPESQQPDPRESPPLPRIVSTHSLHPHYTQGSAFPGLSGLPYFFNEGAASTNGVIPSAQATTAVPIPVLPQVQPSLPNNPDMKNYSVLPENENMGSHVTSSSFCMPPNFAMPGKVEPSLENNTKIMNYPTSLGNHSGQDTAYSSHSIPPNFDMPKLAEASLENNPETMNYQNLLGNDSGHYSSSSSVYPPTKFEVEKFILIEIPAQAEGNSQTMYYPALLGNIHAPGTATSSLPGTSNFVLEKVIIIETPGKAAETSQETPGNAAETSQEMPEKIAETSQGNNSQTTVFGNDSGQDAASSSASIPPNFGYLGDPKRNVKMLTIHLVTAQKKIKPKNAARFLVRNLFTKDILICSSVSANSQGRQRLDPNKMAALREYLARIFPNYDLSEHGKDWKECMSDISSLIRYLCSENKRLQNTVGKNKGPTNPGEPASADLNGKRGSVHSKGHSSLPLQTSTWNTRENGASQQPSNAISKEMKNPSIGNSTAPEETLNYFGNPRRNIQMPYSVLSTAKEKSRPALSARYLIRNLFSEDVLVKSNVYGNLGRGVSALNPNRISALREFLQDVYPTCDLSETGHDWKLCVTAINSCIRSLRYDLKKSIAKSKKLAAATPSAESKPKDTASTD